jgi:hypothetical protein
MYLVYCINYNRDGDQEISIYGLFSTNEEAEEKSLKLLFDDDAVHIKTLNDNEYLKIPWNPIKNPCTDCSICEYRDKNKYSNFMA